MNKRLWLALGLSGALAACGGGDGNETAASQGAPKAEVARQTIGDLLGETGQHNQFMQTMQTAGLAETLRGAGPYTVFAPSDAAFQAIPQDARAQLTEPAQRERLTTLLSYHIVPGTVTAQDLRRAVEQAPGGRAELATVTGRNISIARENDGLVIMDAAGGRARVTEEKIGSNGVIHAIDAVLMPPV